MKQKGRIKKKKMERQEERKLFPVHTILYNTDVLDGGVGQHFCFCKRICDSFCILSFAHELSKNYYRS